MNWYAIVVKPQAERAVEAALGQKNYETFFPVVTTERRWSDRTKRVDAAQLGAELIRIYVTRGEKVLFVTGEKDTEFQKIAAVIDVARGAGITHVALLKPITLID